MCSAVRSEADTCGRDYCNSNHLSLRSLIYVSHALLQMMVHSRFDSKWHFADILQEAFYSEPFLADSPCWIRMTVSNARKYPDLFQKRKIKNIIDENFGINSNFNIFKAAFHHIRKETLNGDDLNYFPLPSPSSLHSHSRYHAKCWINLYTYCAMNFPWSLQKCCFRFWQW